MRVIFTRFFLVAFLLGLFSMQGNAIVIPASPSSTEPDPATVKAAMESFKNLSKDEKKAKYKELKAAIKELKALKKSKAAPIGSTALQVICAILIPPLGVYLHEGEINSKFWIDLLLTLLFYVPGLVYALIVILGDKS
jgi:uncharacterized membrane protein YqaE (UPF0057 family)